MVESLDAMVAHATVYGPGRPIYFALVAVLDQEEFLRDGHDIGVVGDACHWDQEVILVELVAGNILGDDAGVGEGHQHHHAEGAQLQQDRGQSQGEPLAQDQHHLQQDAHGIDQGEGGAEPQHR